MYCTRCHRHTTDRSISLVFPSGLRLNYHRFCAGLMALELLRAVGEADPRLNPAPTGTVWSLSRYGNGAGTPNVVYITRRNSTDSDTVHHTHWLATNSLTARVGLRSCARGKIDELEI